MPEASHILLAERFGVKLKDDGPSTKPSELGNVFPGRPWKTREPGAALGLSRAGFSSVAGFEGRRIGKDSMLPKRFPGSEKSVESLGERLGGLGGEGALHLHRAFVQRTDPNRESQHMSEQMFSPGLAPVETRSNTSRSPHARDSATSFHGGGPAAMMRKTSEGFLGANGVKRMSRGTPSVHSLPEETVNSFTSMHSRQAVLNGLESLNGLNGIGSGVKALNGRTDISRLDSAKSLRSIEATDNHGGRRVGSDRWRANLIAEIAANNRRERHGFGSQVARRDDQVSEFAAPSATAAQSSYESSKVDRSNLEEVGRQEMKTGEKQYRRTNFASWTEFKPSARERSSGHGVESTQALVQTQPLHREESVEASTRSSRPPNQDNLRLTAKRRRTSAVEQVDSSAAPHSPEKPALDPNALRRKERLERVRRKRKLQNAQVRVQFSNDDGNRSKDSPSLVAGTGVANARPAVWSGDANETNAGKAGTGEANSPVDKSKLTEDEKRQQRILKNRISAMKSLQKKQEHADKLESELGTLSKELQEKVERVKEIINVVDRRVRNSERKIMIIERAQNVVQEAVKEMSVDG